jgi:hypothetical protein
MYRIWRSRFQNHFGKPGMRQLASAVFGGVGVMSIRKIVALEVSFLLLAVFANAASRSNIMQIKILDSVTRAVSGDNNGVPLNCDQLTFDAYCRSTSTVPLVSTLLVQEGDAPPFRISCTMESRYSRCTPLPKGAIFDAKRDKHGITVYYVDDKGKERNQLYRLVDTGGNVPPPATMAAVATQPTPAAVGPGVQAAPVATRPQSSPSNSPQSGSNAAPPGPGWVQVVNPEKVRCNFSSTPAGAEITVDGKYVGNTPSEIGLITGNHVVVISLPGFGEWKRELTVAADSAVNVAAKLQKVQP